MIKHDKWLTKSPTTAHYFYQYGGNRSIVDDEMTLVGRPMLTKQAYNYNRNASKIKTTVSSPRQSLKRSSTNGELVVVEKPESVAGEEGVMHQKHMFLREHSM